jgi:hypothetical protein
VSVPGQGHVSIAGAGVVTVRRAVGRAGALRIAVSLTKVERTRLRHRHSLHLRLRVGFVAVSGRSSSTTLSMEVTL